MDIKDLNILERFLPSQNLSKELTSKQVDAGFVQVYEKKLVQSQNTQATRFERQVNISDKRMAKGKMNQSTREIDGLDSRENAAEQATKVLKRKHFNQRVLKAQDTMDTEEPQVAEVSTEGQITQGETLNPVIPVHLDAQEAEKATDDGSILITELMEKFTASIQQMSSGLVALKTQIEGSEETLTPALKNVLDKIEVAITELQNALTQNMNQEDGQTKPLANLESSIKLIAAFQQEIKELLKDLPEQQQVLGMFKAQESSTGQGVAHAEAFNVRHELKQLIQVPIQHMQLNSLLNKVKSGEEKTVVWLDQHLEKMTVNLSKSENGLEKQVLPSSETEIDPILSEIDQGKNTKSDEKKSMAVTNQDASPLEIKVKPEASEKRLVHLEQVGTPMDKQMVKMIERNQEPTHLFKSILTQVQDGVKASLKVMQDGSEMVMKLKPESLGEVSVKVTVHKNTVTAEMTVQSQIVKEALEASLYDLKNTLKDKGFDVNDIQVSINLGNGYKEQSDSREQRFQNGRYLNGLTHLKEDIPAIEQLRAFIQNGRLDYFA